MQEIEKFILTLFFIFVIIIVIVLIISEHNLRYICTDAVGNTYCVKYIMRSDGGDYIKLEDGTFVKIQTYKKVKKEEIENEERYIYN